MPCRVLRAQGRRPGRRQRDLSKGDVHPGQRFASRAFPPPGLYPEDKPFNLALLPLFFQDECLGYVAFDGQDLRPLAAVAVQLASAIKSAQLHDEVLELSLTDGLTEVYNRRYFEILLKKEAERSQRYRRDLAVVMIDIDRFKEYNDVFGHLAGDESLRVGRPLHRQRGAAGIWTWSPVTVATSSCVILPETDREGARIVAENMRKQLRQETPTAKSAHHQPWHRRHARRPDGCPEVGGAGRPSDVPGQAPRAEPMRDLRRLDGEASG